MSFLLHCTNLSFLFSHATDTINFNIKWSFSKAIPRKCHPRKTGDWRVYDRLLHSRSILQLAAIGAKLIALQGGLQVGK